DVVETGEDLALVDELAGLDRPIDQPAADLEREIDLLDRDHPLEAAVGEIAVLAPGRGRRRRDHRHQPPVTDHTTDLEPRPDRAQAGRVASANRLSVRGERAGAVTTRRGA